MPETMNELRIRCPKCASENVTPKQLEINRPEPPLKVLMDHEKLLIRQNDVGSQHLVSMEVHCNACSAGSFWINTLMSNGELWVKVLGDPDDDEQGPQPEATTTSQTRRR